MNKAYLAVILVAVCLAGCTAASITYDQQDSEAMNIANAAGLQDGLKDVEIPKDTVTSLRDSAAYGAAFAASGYNTPSPGLTRGGTAALNFASWLLEPEKPSSKSHIIAWQPSGDGDANSARTELVEALSEASQKAASAFGMNTWVKMHSNDTAAYLFISSGNDEYCAGNEYCLLFGFILDEPRSVKNSPEVSGVMGESWLYSPYDRSRFTFNKQYMGFSELEFLQKVSKHLPSWSYLYAPPQKLKLSDTEHLQAPVFVNTGRALFFVKPEKD